MKIRKEALIVIRRCSPAPYIRYKNPEWPDVDDKGEVKYYYWSKEHRGLKTLNIMDDALPKEIFDLLPGEPCDWNIPQPHPPFFPYKKFPSEQTAFEALGIAIVKWLRKEG